MNIFRSSVKQAVAVLLVTALLLPPSASLAHVRDGCTKGCGYTKGVFAAANGGNLFERLLDIFFDDTNGSDPASSDEIIDEDGNINEKLFEREWRTYSDFPTPALPIDESWPLQSRSWEVQQYYGIQDQINNLKYESAILQAEMEFGRQMRLELREYRKNLVQNIRVNLLRSFWRLSFMTYDTIKGGVKTGKSYSKLFTATGSATVLQGLSNVKNALDVVDGHPQG